MSQAAVDPVTGRWVSALWNLAAGQGKTDGVMADLEQLAHEFQIPAVRAYFLGGTVSAGDRKTKLQPLLDTFLPLTQNFLGLCLERDRMGVMPIAFEAFRRRRMQEEGIQEGHVETPRPLEASDVEALEQSLGGRLGKTIRLTQSTNSDLVGGVRVTVGDKMIDASIAGRMDGLRRRLLEVRLPSAASAD